MNSFVESVVDVLEHFILYSRADSVANVYADFLAKPLVGCILDLFPNSRVRSFANSLVDSFFEFCCELVCEGTCECICSHHDSVSWVIFSEEYPDSNSSS